MTNNTLSALELDKQLKASAEYLLVEEIRGFRRSITLLDGNYNQLKEQLEFFEDARQSLYLDQANHHAEKLHFQAEIMRLLHNYVTAVLSLIDHSRIHYRKLYQSDVFPEYQHQVENRFDKDPLASFVKGLRQYFQHYGLPGMYFQTEWRQDNPVFTRTIHLRNDELKAFDWKAKAKEYLEAQTEDINLTKLIDAYQSKVVEFYEWFQVQQEQLHAKEIEKVEQVRAKIRRVVLPDILNATLQLPGLTAESFEATLLPYIGNAEQIVLALMGPDSKPDFLIRVFRSIADISPAVERKIRALFHAV